MTPRHLIPFLLVAAGCSGQGQTPAATASASASLPPSTMAATSMAGPTIVVEVVTIDTSAPSLTLREGDVPPLKAPGPNDIKPTDRTIRVESSASSSLAALKPGQRIRVSCSAAPAATTTGASMAGSPAASPASSLGSSPAAPAGGSGTGAMSAAAVPADLARCDSIVAVTPLESPAAP